jgi:nucleotide-binding universal stress UspA family protein
MTTKTILVPIDFKKPSLKGLELATMLAQKINARIFIMHALQNQEISPKSGSSTDSEDVIKKAEKDAYDEFELLKKSMNSLHEVEHTFVVLHAFAQEGIISMTNSQTIDLIVMGTKASNRLKGILIGNNTFSITKNVKCPVLAVPDGADTKRLFKNIGLAGDYKETASKNAFEIMLNIATAFNSHIHVVHMSEIPSFNPTETEEAKKLDRYLHGLNHRFVFKLNKDLDEGLNEFIGENEIDLLTLVNKRKDSLDHIFQLNSIEKRTNLAKVPFLILNTK